MQSGSGSNSIVKNKFATLAAANGSFAPPASILSMNDTAKSSKSSHNNSGFVYLYQLSVLIGTNRYNIGYAKELGHIINLPKARVLLIANMANAEQCAATLYERMTINFAHMDFNKIIICDVEQELLRSFIDAISMMVAQFTGLPNGKVIDCDARSESGDSVKSTKTTKTSKTTLSCVSGKKSAGSRAAIKKVPVIKTAQLLDLDAPTLPLTQDVVNAVANNSLSCLLNELHISEANRARDLILQYIQEIENHFLHDTELVVCREFSWLGDLITCDSNNFKVMNGNALIEKLDLKCSLDCLKNIRVTGCVKRNSLVQYLPDTNSVDYACFKMDSMDVDGTMVGANDQDVCKSDSYSKLDNAISPIIELMEASIVPTTVPTSASIAASTSTPQHITCEYVIYSKRKIAGVDIVYTSRLTHPIRSDAIPHKFIGQTVNLSDEETITALIENKHKIKVNGLTDAVRAKFNCEKDFELMLAANQSIAAMFMSRNKIRYIFDTNAMVFIKQSYVCCVVKVNDKLVTLTPQSKFPASTVFMIEFTDGVYGKIAPFKLSVQRKVMLSSQNGSATVRYSVISVIV